MRLLITLLLITTIHSVLSAQKINYNIPEGYEADISPDDYKKIVDLAVPMAAKRYVIDEVRDGTIYLKAGQDMKACNLHNLIGKCVAVSDKSKWPGVVQEHFNNVYQSMDAQKKFDPTNYEDVKKYLSLRIYRDVDVKAMGASIIRTDLQGTSTMLMFDLPGAFRSVQPELFSLWKQDTTEVFKMAQENVNKQTVEKVPKNFENKGGPIEIIFLGNEDYAASYALDLINNSPDLVGEWGSVIALPNKGLVEICKVSKNHPVDFVVFIQRTKNLIDQSYQTHPQRISNQYFWYYHGKFKRIDVFEEDGNIQVISPYGLSELMTEK